MYTFEIIVGTTLGSAEYVADHLVEKLVEQGFKTNIHLDPKLTDLPINKNNPWIICTATHGAGDFPENILPFTQQLEQNSPDLSNVKYSVIALGSKSYDQFCNAGHMIDRQLAKLKAEKVAITLEICTLETPIPEDMIDIWYPEWSQNWL
ncbi:FMN-binding protein MioC [Moritella sp. 24]|uniref:FMN-binding protein MioC n=1 Tax=Moritella sp. 24 TaxID=2746230 RepID=UPI001BAAA4DC|nr:FMN-binding protein MioC [Moritella sp. 24]QUM78428.1 FMN-binding protein MioC [Moritella sp. 24]